MRDVEFLRANTDRRIKITLPGPFTMSQQAQNDHYPRSAESCARPRPCGCRGGTAISSPRARTSCRSTSRTCKRARRPAAEYGLEVINIALADAPGPTALHTCFGYGHIVHDKPPGYPFLAELDDCAADEISLETAQPRLDLSILEQLPSKRIALGVLDLGTAEVETVQTVVARAREALRSVDPERLVLAPDCG